MRNIMPYRSVVLIVLAGVVGGCTIHPPGERQEQQAALNAGKPYEKSAEARTAPVLADRPTPDDLVQYALLTNAQVEQQYWQWRAALEQVAIDGTQSSNLAISVGTTLNNGAFSLDRTTVAAGSDPMTDIVLPPKLSTAARRSLENAKAAGMRFRKAQFEVRRKVLEAYDDYSIDAELIRLGEENIGLLQMTATLTEARNRSGMAGEQDVLRVQNEVDMATNDVANMQSMLPIERAALNALLNRAPTAAIPIPATLPATRLIVGSDQYLLDRAAQVNPELIALDDEFRAKHEEIHLARLEYVPDISLSASTDLKGMAQTLLGQFTVPIIRYEALRAAVDQAEANLNAAQAVRRQTGNDLAAQLVDDIATLRDADRQLDLLRHTILPRAHQVVGLARTAYETGSASLLDILDSQRSLIDIERLAVNLESARDKRLVEIEAIDAINLDAY